MTLEEEIGVIYFESEGCCNQGKQVASRSLKMQGKVFFTAVSSEEHSSPATILVSAQCDSCDISYLQNCKIIICIAINQYVYDNLLKLQ